MGKSKVVYLSRDGGSSHSSYDVHVDGLHKPTMDSGLSFSGDVCFCSTLWERVTGFKLEPGTAVRVRINVEPVRRKKR